MKQGIEAAFNVANAKGGAVRLPASAGRGGRRLRADADGGDNETALRKRAGFWISRQNVGTPTAVVALSSTRLIARCWSLERSPGLAYCGTIHPIAMSSITALATRKKPPLQGTIW